MQWDHHYHILLEILNQQQNTPWNCLLGTSAGFGAVYSPPVINITNQGGYSICKSNCLQQTIGYLFQMPWMFLISQ